MKFCKYAIGFAFQILILFAAFTHFAQIGETDFNRARTVDVRHYLIRTSFDPNRKTIFGDTTVSFNPLAGDFDTLELDAVGLKFESVKMEPEGKILNFRTANEKVFVKLGGKYTPKDLIKVRFKYSATPEKGVYFIGAENLGNGKIRDAQIWTQGETEESRHWFPSYDFPDDKATTEQFLTVARDETVISNGELLKTAENGDGTKTVHFRMSVPHAVYLTSFVIGKYTRVSDSYGNIPLGIYLYPDKEHLAQNAFGNTKEMMRIFEELTGIDYPFPKYDQTIVANFHFGGMENITATTFSDEQIYFADFAFGKPFVEDLVSHELAHSWFGNLVTCRNWAELWLNESFATFMEAAYREKMYGRPDYLRKIKADAAEYFAADSRIRRKHGLYNQLARPDDSIFDAINYQKGAAVVHTLRETVGDKVFWKALNFYLERHKFGNVETMDLQKVFEETSKTDLDWFFNQWVYGSNYPKLEVSPRFNPQKKLLTLLVKQTQKPEELTPAAFILPLELEIQTAGGKISEKIMIRKREEAFSFKLNEAPQKIVFDKDVKIPLKSLKIQDM